MPPQKLSAQRMEEIFLGLGRIMVKYGIRLYEPHGLRGSIFVDKKGIMHFESLNATPFHPANQPEAAEALGLDQAGLVLIQGPTPTPEAMQRMGAETLEFLNAHGVTKVFFRAKSALGFKDLGEGPRFVASRLHIEALN